MSFKVITAVATEPVTSAEAKLHLRVDGDDDDTLIAALITAARQVAEHYTGRALAVQTLEMALDAFPDDDYFDLAMPPVASITHIKYTDEDGVEQTLATDQYALSTYGDSRRVSLTYDASWPDTRCIPDAVRVRYVAGYGGDGGPAVPKAVTQSILLMVGWMYENRGDDARIQADDIQPPAAKALLGTVKLWGR